MCNTMCRCINSRKKKKRTDRIKEENERTRFFRVTLIINVEADSRVGTTTMEKKIKEEEKGENVIDFQQAEEQEKSR